MIGTLDDIVGKTIFDIKYDDGKHIILYLTSDSDDDNNSDDNSDDGNNSDSDDTCKKFECKIYTVAECCGPSSIIIQDLDDFQKIIGHKITSAVKSRMKYRIPSYCNGADNAYRVYLNSNDVNVSFVFYYHSQGYYHTRLEVEILGLWI